MDDDLDLAARVPRGLGGFLLLLIVLLAWESIGALLVPIAYVIMGILRSPLGLLIGAAWGCLGAYGIFCCVLLVRKDRRAPRHAALWFVASIGVAVAFLVKLYFAPEPRTPELVLLITFRIMFSGIWLSYLARSQRVKATFGTAALW